MKKKKAVLQKSLVKAVVRRFDFTTTPAGLCSQWRGVREGALTVGKAACWRDDSWEELGDYLKYLIETKPDGISLGFQALNGALVVDFKPNFEKSEILENGKVIVIADRSSGGMAIVWTKKERYEKGIEVNRPRAVGIRLMVVAYPE